MDVQTLLGDITLQKFLEDHWHRLPLAVSGTAGAVCELGTWSALSRLLCVQSVDAMVVRDGQQRAGPLPADEAAARKLSDEGYTILVRHAERYEPRLAALARAFESTLLGPANIHVYATPPGRHGFSWHYDAEDVFILQTTGEKEYALRKNTVNPWPLEETLPADMRYEREIMPLLRVLLKAGDMLYIPCGYWHQAKAPAGEETAISLALGVMAPSGIDVLDFLRAGLLDSILWRQRLPAEALAPEANGERLAEFLALLAADVPKFLTRPSFAEALLADLRRRYRGE